MVMAPAASAVSVSGSTRKAAIHLPSSKSYHGQSLLHAATATIWPMLATLSTRLVMPGPERR